MLERKSKNKRESENNQCNKQGKQIRVKLTGFSVNVQTDVWSNNIHAHQNVTLEFISQR